MTKLGDAFVEVSADFSRFDRQVSSKLAGSFKGAGEKAGRDFSDGFNRDTNGLLLPFVRDLDKATTSATRNSGAVGKVAQAARESSTAMNAFAKDGNAAFEGSRAAAAETAAKIREEFSNLTPAKKLDLKLAGANAEAAELQAHLIELGQQKPSPKVDMQIAAALADLDRVKLKVKDLSAQRAEIKVDVDQSAFAHIKESISELFTATGGSGGGGLTGATTRLSAGFLSFGSSIGSVVALLGTLAVTIGVSLVGAFAALAASMALAAVGAAAVGVALAAALGPAIVLGVAVASRVTKVFEALKAQDAAAGSIGAKTAVGSQAAAAAVAQLTSAESARTEAIRQAGIARSNAFREEADAAEKARDAVASVETAHISLDRAKLSTERAKLELDKFRESAGAAGQAFGTVFQKFTDVSVDTSGLKKALADANSASGGKLDKTQELDLRDKILAVREARDAEKAATDHVSDALTTASRAQADDNKFKREGIRASEGYRAALRGVESATLAVKAAQESQGASSAQQKAIDLTGKLSKKEQQLLEVVKKVRTELRGAFTPATDAVFGGVIKAAGRLPQLINPLRKNFKALGEAAGRSFDKVSKGLVTPESISKLQAFTDAAKDLTGPVTDGLSALSDILTDIARAALPFLVDGTKKVAKQLKDWSKSTGEAKKLDKTIGSLVGHLKTWLGVTAAVGDVFLAFLESAAGPGKGLADSIKDLAERTATWLRSKEGRRELAQFFKDAIAFAKDFAKFMGVIVIATVKFGQTAARVLAQVTDKLGGPKNAAKVLLATLGTLATFKIAASVFSSLRTLKTNIDSARKAATILHSKFFANTAEDAGAGLVGKAKAALSSIGSALASTGRAVVSAGRRVAARLIAVFATEGALAGAAAGNAAAGAEGLAKPSIKTKAAAAGRLVGRAFGLGIVAGVVAGLVGLADQVNKSLTKALVGKGGVRGLQNFADDRNNNPLSKALGDFTKKLTGLFGGHAAGGIIPGSGNRDTYAALLTPGEAVTRKRIVERFGPTTFADINAGRLDPRVGYGIGERPSLTATPVSGPRFATGGLVGAGAAVSGGTTVHASFPITVPGGGLPDPVVLGVMSSRVIEQRFGGDVRQD